MMLRTRTRALFLFLITVMTLAACGGKLDQRKQQVTIGITPNTDVELEIGERLGLNASAKAIDEPLTEIRWTIEPVTLPERGARPVISNQTCTEATLTIKDGDGVGSCRAELSIPDNAEPMTWRIAATATATSKGFASASFVLEVVAPERDNGNFRLDVPALVTTDSTGQPLFANRLVSITATGLSDLAITDLTYQWVQKSGQAVTVAGAGTPTLQFVPRNAGDYVFTVTALGTINGREETVSTDVLVIVNESQISSGLAVFAGNAQSVASGDLVTLTGQATLNGVAVTNPQYQWTQVSGTAVTLANSTSATPTFFAPVVSADTSLVFRLTITTSQDGVSYSGEATTVVRVTPAG